MAPPQKDKTAEAIEAQTVVIETLLTAQNLLIADLTVAVQAQLVSSESLAETWLHYSKFYTGGPDPAP